MNRQEHPPKTEAMFCIDDLMGELKTCLRQELEKAGKTNIEADTCPFSEGETCWIVADRECLRQVLVILLDNAVKFTDRGFIFFGYYLLATGVVDFFVEDTGLGEYNDTVIDLTEVRNLLQQAGSRLKEEVRGTGSKYSFTVKGFTNLIKN
jgi:hypothetical protein